MTVVAFCAVCGRRHHDLARVLQDVGDGPASASCPACGRVTGVTVARIGTDVHSGLCFDGHRIVCLCGLSDRQEVA